MKVLGRGEDLTTSLGFLYSHPPWLNVSPVDGALQGVALGVQKGHARAPKVIRSSHKAPGGRFKSLGAPCRKVPRCPPDTLGGVSVRFRTGSTGFWCFEIWIK